MHNEGGEEPHHEPPQNILHTTNKGTPYSGMVAATRKGGLGTPATITQELTWQWSMGGV